MIRLVVALWLALCGVANAQLAGGLQFPGPGMPASVAASYTGPGDVVSGATAWGSCARVYSLAQASTSTSMCDLKDATTGTVSICTLRGSSTGFVDLAGSYCTGSTTPAVACAAAAGGACKVSKVYDQAGATGGWTQATAASMPVLTFSALNGLPGITFASASNNVMATGNVTIAQPYTFIGVYKRTSGTTLSGVLTNGGGGAGGIGPSNAASTAFMDGGVALTAAATDNQFHALLGVFNSASSSIVVDGSAISGNAGAGGPTAQPLRMGRSTTGGITIDGVIMELAAYAIGFNVTQYGNMNTNIHGVNGYNF